MSLLFEKACMHRWLLIHFLSIRLFSCLFYCYKVTLKWCNETNVRIFNQPPTQFHFLLKCICNSAFITFKRYGPSYPSNWSWKNIWYTPDIDHKYVNITITDSLGWVLQSARPWQQGPYFKPVVPLQTKQAGLWWILRKLGQQIFHWQGATKQGMH